MIIYPTSQRLLINMCGYDNNKDWANYLEDAIKEATQVIWGDYSIALKNLESLLLIIKEMDAVEFRDYIHRINKYLQIYDDLSVNKSTKTLTAQDISEIIFSKRIIEYYKYHSPDLFFKTATNKSKTKYYLSKPFGLPRNTIRNWVVYEFGLQYSNLEYINGEYNKYYPYSHRARIFSLHNNDRFKRVIIKNSILIPSNDTWAYKNPWADEISLIYSIDSKWMYPHPKVISIIWKQIDELWGMTKNTESVEDITGYVSQIHWLMSQSKIFRRSNASIADMLTKSIFDSLEIKTSNWRGPKSNRFDNPNQALEKFINKFGIAPDLEAFVTPIEEYIINYKYFMEKSPTKLIQ